jgi:hypothetical protein
MVFMVKLELNPARKGPDLIPISPIIILLLRNKIDGYSDRYVS